MSEGVPADNQAPVPKLTNVDDFYRELSALITRAVVNHTTTNWPDFFIGLRALINRVLSETAEDVLSREDKAALVSGLIDHITELERAWPNLAGKLETLKVEPLDHDFCAFAFNPDRQAKYTCGATPKKKKPRRGYNRGGSPKRPRFLAATC